MYSGSLAIFVPFCFDLFRSATASAQVSTKRFPTWTPPFGKVASVCPSTSACLPFDFLQTAWFFQNPIVLARPPGGRVLLTVIDLDSPAATVKLTHRVLLSTSCGGLPALSGKNAVGSSASVVSQPGWRFVSHSW